MTDRFVPLAELAEHPDNPHISWQLPLPEYSGVDDLALNVTAANRMACLGALMEVSFRPGRRQEEDQPVVGDMSGLGAASAAATLGMTRQKQYSDIRLEEIFDSGGDDVPFWRKATVDIDLNNISDTLSRQQQLREPTAWARQLNHTVMNGLKRAALKNTHENAQINGQTGVIALSVGVTTSTALTLSTLDIPMDRAWSVAVTYASVQLPVIVGMETYSNIKEARKGGLPFRMIPHNFLPYAIDRQAYIAIAALRYRNLIRYMPGGESTAT